VNPTPTYLSCLTPAGTGAIATLAVRGPRAWAVVRELFRRARTQLSPTAGGAGQGELPAEPEAGRFWVGRLGEEAKGGSDEVVLAVRRGGPDPWLEVHCHGGREVVGLLEEVLAARGLEVLPWPDLERRTGDVLRAGALTALARAPTVRTASILLDQVHGAFARAVEAARTALERGDGAEAGRLLGELAGRASLGRHLTEPWKVVVAGAPNVGKSSLVNALAGYRRSLVTPTPGTTRDVVTVQVAQDGWPVELADTAGWRAGAGSLERQGIELAQAAAGGADLCLWVLDASAEPVWPPHPYPSPPGGRGANLERVRFVLNKVDLPPAWNPERAVGAVRVSAKTGEGLAALAQAIAGWLVPELPPAGAAVPFTEALCAAVEVAARHAAEGDSGQALAAPAELRG
jgi:tRNA modification GTPase